ncbi:hypothetical protein LJR225_002335 [Phenylobacterium sp. LjRoot225]
MAVADVPWPAAAAAPLRAGDLVLDRQGRAFGRAVARELATGLG